MESRLKWQVILEKSQRVLKAKERKSFKLNIAKERPISMRNINKPLHITLKPSEALA